ncbi:MAG: MoaD/ThiS family protein [Acidimicrobiia bacterium]
MGDDRVQVTLRLFAGARELAGRSSESFEATTLGELLDRACVAYGERFEALLRSSKVWLNGDQAAGGREQVLRSGDEVAVLPPVSGG